MSKILMIRPDYLEENFVLVLKDGENLFDIGSVDAIDYTPLAFRERMWTEKRPIVRQIEKPIPILHKSVINKKKTRKYYCGLIVEHSKRILSDGKPRFAFEILEILEQEAGHTGFSDFGVNFISHTLASGGIPFERKKCRRRFHL
jgi:hypothetical protein